MPKGRKVGQAARRRANAKGDYEVFDDYEIFDDYEVRADYEIFDFIVLRAFFSSLETCACERPISAEISV